MSREETDLQNQSYVTCRNIYHLFKQCEAPNKGTNKYNRKKPSNLTSREHCQNHIIIFKIMIMYTVSFSSNLQEHNLSQLLEVGVGDPMLADGAYT